MKERVRTTHRSRLVKSPLRLSRGVPLAAGALLACGIQSACGPAEPEANLALDTEAAFVAIPRVVSAETRALRQHSLKTHAVVDQVGSGDDFYLAINRKELGKDKRWFLSGYMRQGHPAGVYGGAAVSTGTRVVSFKAQNNRVYIFDTDSRKKTSDIFDPEVLVDAYPVVSYPPFDRLPGSSQFVLVDPAAGLNKFAALGDVYAADSQAPDRVQVELSFLQGYRETTAKDGITWEQVFTGYGEVQNPGNPGLGEDNQFLVAGTLGVGLRRYSETMGFTPGPVVTIGGQDVYFRSDKRILPDEGAFIQNSIKWGVSSTKPIEFVVSSTVDKLQMDPRYSGYSLYDAIAKGVTNWNAVFGYTALTVRKATADDNFGQDDKNFIIVDTDPNFGAAFANWRTNPNTGEIRGASVYFSPGFIDIADIIFSDDPLLPLTKLGTVDRPKVRQVVWDPLALQQPKDNCILWSPIYKDARRGHDSTTEFPRRGIPLDAALTKKAKVEQYITHVVLHEVGHTLGLRHNFKGSLTFDDAKKVYSSSVMEYVDDNDAIFADKPLTFDTDAIKYLYGISMTRPSGNFCNDSMVGVDPDCERFDRTDNPYTKVYLPPFVSVNTDFLDGKSTVSANFTLNDVLDYVRNGQTSAARMAAWNAVTDSMGYSIKVGKVDATKLAMLTGYGARVDFMARRVISRLFFDAPGDRLGRFTGDPTDSAILAQVLTEVKGIVKNTDKIRSVASRRVAARYLKKIQTIEAYTALAEGAAKLDGDIRAGVFTGDEAVLATDTLKYMDSLMNPYFNN